MESIKPLIEFGHIHFGENKVQEAVEKWTLVKEKNPEIKLHMIGRLQRNKVKLAVNMFDFIHSVDNIKLAKKISEEQKKLNKKLSIFLQVNIGGEIQKSGIDMKYISQLYAECLKLNLNVVGLMCIPPLSEPARKYFTKIKNCNDELQLPSLSLGMSNDYLEAIEVRSNFLRIGTKIFGQRG